MDASRVVISDRDQRLVLVVNRYGTPVSRNRSIAAAAPGIRARPA
jgi:hypothetical protein